MIKVLLLILLALLQIVPDPRLTARWDTATSATVSWSQETRGCLYRNTTFISCYEAPGAYTITFGHVGPLDYSARTQANDIYFLQTGGQTYRAPLIGRPQYLAVWRT